MTKRPAKTVSPANVVHPNTPGSLLDKALTELRAESLPVERVSKLEKQFEELQRNHLVLHNQISRVQQTSQSPGVTATEITKNFIRARVEEFLEGHRAEEVRRNQNLGESLTKVVETHVEELRKLCLGILADKQETIDDMAEEVERISYRVEGLRASRLDLLTILAFLMALGALILMGFKS